MHLLTQNCEQPPATAFMHLLIFDACSIIGDNVLGDNFARGCGACKESSTV